MRALGWIAAAAIGLASAALAQHPAGQGDGGARRRPPPLAVGADFAPDGTLWVVALDERQRLVVRTSGDQGRSWSPPRTLDTGSDRIAADGENRPKIAFGPAGQAVISYTEPLARPYTGRIRMLRSPDGGGSFSAPFTVHADRQEITHRFESIAFDGRGTLHTLWIDKRDLEALEASAAQRAPADAAPPSSAQSPRPSASAPGEAGSGQGGRRTRPAVDYRGAAIYRNESSDGGASFGPDVKLADHSCECCRIALAPAPDGTLVAMWRHVFAPNERDHAFAPVGARAATTLATPAATAPGASRGDGPVRASFDHWALDACPHHGPGLAARSTGGYHAVWFGDRAGEARVRYGRLAADGTPQGEVRALPDERAEHAAVASAGERVVITWRSFDGSATQWRAWVSADGGKRFALRELGRSSGDNDHPLLLRRGETIFALWRTAQEIRVERIEP